MFGADGGGGRLLGALPGGRTRNPTTEACGQRQKKNGKKRFMRALQETTPSGPGGPENKGKLPR